MYFMPRFTKQHDRFSCGPTAIANALKWAGKALNYRVDKKRLCDVVRCQQQGGTTPNSVEIGLKKLGKKYFTVNNTKLSIPQLRKHLVCRKNAAIIRFIWPDLPHGHYVFIDDYKPQWFGGMYHIVNLYADGPAGRWVTEKYFKWMVSKRYMAKCWSLTRK